MHRALGLEHPLHAALLELHLGTADGQRAELLDAVLLLEARRRGRRPRRRRARRPSSRRPPARRSCAQPLRRRICMPAGPAANTAARPASARVELVAGLRLDDLEARLPARPGCPRRGDGRPPSRRAGTSASSPRRPRGAAARPCAVRPARRRSPPRLAALQRHRAADQRDGGRGGRVRAVGVEHDRRR